MPYERVVLKGWKVRPSPLRPDALDERGEREVIRRQCEEKVDSEERTRFGRVAYVMFVASREKALEGVADIRVWTVNERRCRSVRQQGLGLLEAVMKARLPMALQPTVIPGVGGAAGHVRVANKMDEHHWSRP